MANHRWGLTPLVRWIVGDRTPRLSGGIIAYELLLDGRERIDNWSICTGCLSVERSTAVGRRNWRCSDCGIDASNDSQQALRAYLAANPPQTLERNLREWSATQGMRPAYKMLRSARYKCLLSLSRSQGSPSAP
jgi:hypothetical protein